MQHLKPLKPFRDARFWFMPREIISKNDGDIHFIDERQLMRCYGISHEQVAKKDEIQKAIWLGPRYDGDYREHLYARLKARGFVVPVGCQCGSLKYNNPHLAQEHGGWAPER